MTDLASSTQVQRLVADIAHVFEQVHRELAVLAEDYRQLIRFDSVAGQVAPFKTAELQRMRELSAAILQRNPVVDGCGFVFNPERIVAFDQIFQWWVRGENDVEPYGFVYDPESPNFYDFTTLPWYTVPAETGVPKFCGPYIDFLGVDGFIVTFSVPLSIDGEFIGVATADMPVANLERLFFEHIRHIPAYLALTSSLGRIIAGNTSRFLPGDPVELEKDDTVVEIPTTVPMMNLVIRPRDN